MRLSIDPRVSAGLLRRLLLTPGLCAVLCCCALAASLAAQTASSPSTPAASSVPNTSNAAPAKRVHAHKKSKAKNAAVPAPAPAAPAPPPMPNWPVNDKPQPAKIAWDSHGLRIEAANSSLMQIMSDVSTATGAKVVGLNRDERVFGTYGPAPARDVLTQLLQGTGYNIMVLGSEDSRTPMQVLLTPRGGGRAAASGATVASAGSADEEPGEPEPEEPQTPVPPPNAPPNAMGQPNGPPRTPQQILQQMRQSPNPPEQGAPPQNQ